MIDITIIKKRLTEMYDTVYISILSLGEENVELIFDCWNAVIEDITDEVIEFLNRNYEKPLVYIPKIQTIDCEVYRSNHELFESSKVEWYESLKKTGISFKLDSLLLLSKAGDISTCNLEKVVLKIQKEEMFYIISLVDVIKRKEPLLGINLCFSTDSRFEFDYPLQIMDRANDL